MFSEKKPSERPCRLLKEKLTFLKRSSKPMRPRNNVRLNENPGELLISGTRKYICKVNDQNSVLAWKETTAAWKRGKKKWPEYRCRKNRLPNRLSNRSVDEGTIQPTDRPTDRPTDQLTFLIFFPSFGLYISKSRQRRCNKQASGAFWTPTSR